MRKSHATTQQLLQMEQKNMEADKKQALYEKEILDIQNQALRLHMNPHFIFNSINSIQGFYASGDTALARSYIGKFSTLLRMILDQSKKKFIDINDEVKTIEYYLELNKLRFENKFDYEISVDKTLLIHREEIPPMLLQPFIENAIIHGIAPLKRPGKIIVRLLDDKDFIRCEIEDNGVGRAYSRNMNVNKTYESTGIKVTEKRIELNNKMIIGLHQDEVVISDILNSAGEVMGTLVQFSVLKNSI
jgi:sensor histidine kinase YesM